MARIAGINIPDNKHLVIALTYIYGIGNTRARDICAASGLAPDSKVRDLSEGDLDKVRSIVGKYEPFVRRGQINIENFIQPSLA